MKSRTSFRFIFGVVILASMFLGNPLLRNSAAQTPPQNVPTATDTLPSDIDPNSPLAQVINLVQAGVEQSVILNYINNSTGLFNLDADQIIYLNDLGVPTEIINAMMQHDQQLEQNGAVPAPAPEPVGTAETTAQPTEVTVNYFYDTLAPYGVWVNVTGCGWCWRPTVVVYNPAWQPYCNNGHWVYTDDGWYWASGYSWGWAAFHYGRWFHDPRYGWCWWPNTTWAPSWVCWRHDRNYCGWAPLPPHTVYQPGVGIVFNGHAVSIGFDFGLSASAFTFVPTRDFCDLHPWQHRLGERDVAGIYGHTTVVHGFDFDRNRQTVVNAGIPPRDITAVTKRPIHPVAVRYEASGVAQGNRGERFERGGRTLVVKRPHFVGSPVLSVHPESRPATGHYNEVQPVVHGGENNLSPHAPPPTQNNYRHFNNGRYDNPGANHNPAQNFQRYSAPPAQNQAPYYHYNYNYNDRSISPRLYGQQQPYNRGYIREPQEGGAAERQISRSSTANPEPAPTPQREYNYHVPANESHGENQHPSHPAPATPQPSGQQYQNKGGH